MAAQSRHSAFMLLEIVVAVGLLVLGLAVIGGQMQTAADLTRETDHTARLVFLAESRLAELDSGLVVPNEEVSDETGIEIEADFGRLFPQYASRVTLKPTATVDLIAVQLDIFFDPERTITESGKALEEFDYDDDLIVQTYHTLRVAPKPLNLRTDFGLDDEIADKLDEQLADSSIGATLSTDNFTPEVFAQFDLEQLAELIQILMAATGDDKSAILQLVPQEMRSQLETMLQGLDALTGEGDSDTGGSDAGGSGDSSGGSDAGTDDGSGTDSTGGADSGTDDGSSGSTDNGSSGGSGTRRPSRPRGGRGTRG